MSTHFDTMTEEDKQVMTAALLQWKADGVENPTIPTDYDLDGDGTADAFGLDENNKLIVVPGVHLSTTVYASDGDDIGKKAE